MIVYDQIVVWSGAFVLIVIVIRRVSFGLLLFVFRFVDDLIVTRVVALNDFVVL